MGFIHDSKKTAPNSDTNNTTTTDDIARPLTTTEPKPTREPFFKYRYSEQAQSTPNNQLPHSNSSPAVSTSEQPSSDLSVPAIPRRKSWMERWKNLTNPQAEFSEEEIKRRTGMSREEFREWVNDPRNMEETRKYRTSDVAWAMGGGI